MIKFVLTTYPMYMIQTESINDIPADSGRIDSMLFLDPEAPLQNTNLKTYPSLFVSSKEHNELSAQDRVPTEHPVWIPLILLLCFVLLAWGRLFFRRSPPRNRNGHLIRDRSASVISGVF